MSPEHLMVRIETAYAKEIRRAAKQYAPKGTDWEDMYQEILIAVHDRVRRRKVGLRDYRSMKNTVNQRAIDLSRKAVLYHRRFTPVEKIAETARYADSPATVLEDMRIAELKTKLRRSLSVLDARIVVGLVFPSSSIRTLARKRPTRKGPILKKVDARRIPTVRKWHVAKFFGVSDARVAEAIRKAKEIIGDVLKDEKGGIDLISVFVSNVWQGATVVDDNTKTLWVSLPDGRIIKRHKTKHRMEKYEEAVVKTECKLTERPSWWRRLWNWLKGIWGLT